MDTNPEKGRDATRRQRSAEDSPTAPRPGGYPPTGIDQRATPWVTLKRTATEFSEDRLTTWAAALTYYSLLSLVPALIALVSLLGVFGDPRSTTNTVIDIITKIGPASSAQTFSGPIRSITANHSAAGFALVLGLLAALWAASSYVGAFIQASNVIYETPEGRPFWKLRPLQILITLIMVVLMVLVALGLALTGPIVDAVAKPIGISGTATGIWNIAKWPILAMLFITMISVLYYASPNVKVRGFRWVTPGSVVALVIWVLASAGFAVYVANFGSYDKTYGTLAGVVVLLIWLWITNLAILFGHELNAERERSLELKEGVPRAEREIQLKPRHKPGDRRTR